MDKFTNKRTKYNQEVIKILSEAYGVEIDTVRKALRGDRSSETSEKIKKEYKRTATALKQAKDLVLKNMIKQ